MKSDRGVSLKLVTKTEVINLFCLSYGADEKNTMTFTWQKDFEISGLENLPHTKDSAPRRT